MQLKGIRLSNYRRFRDLDLEIPDGILAIVGPNGSGKSTLLEAVAWCLFGSDAARTSKELIRNANAATGDDVSATIDFVLDSHAYKVTRRQRGKSQQSEAQVSVDGALVVAPGANSSELAVSYLERALGLDRRGFLSTVLTQQGDVAALTEATPAERKRVILGLLGIGRVDDAIATARGGKRDASIRILSLRRVVQDRVDIARRLREVESQLESAQVELAPLAQEADKVRADLALAEESRVALESARNQHVESKQRLEQLQRSRQAGEGSLQRLGIELRRLDERGAERKRHQDIGRRFAELDASLERLSRQREVGRRLAVVHAQASAGGEEIKRWTSVLNGDEPSKQDSPLPDRSGLDRLAAEIGRLRSDDEHLERERRRLELEAEGGASKWRDLAKLGAQAPCPACGRELGDTAQRLMAHAAEDARAKRAEAQVLRERATQARTQVEALERERAALATALKDADVRVEQERKARQAGLHARAEIDLWSQRLTILDAEEAELKSQHSNGIDEAALERLRVERDQWRATDARLDVELQRAPSVRSDHSAAQAQLAETRAEIESTSRALRELAYREGAWEAARAHEHTVSTRAGDLSRRCAVLEERLAGQARQGEELRAILFRTQDAQGELDAAEKELRLLDLLAADRGDAGILPEFRTHLIARVRPALAQATGALLSAMTNGRYADLEIDEEYTVRLFDGGKSWPMERFSGGESDVVHLAVRLAISELLAESRQSSQLSFVALDEVLASQDESRRQSVLASLQSLRGRFRQIWVVTHVDEVRERVDHVLRVFPDGDGSSRVVASWTEKG